MLQQIPHPNALLGSRLANSENSLRSLRPVSTRPKMAEKSATNQTSLTCSNRKSATTVVIKPDAGTHGKGIVLSKNREELVANIKQTEPSIINPVGIVAQELIEKWFYDLRIIVYKEKRKDPVCHPIGYGKGRLQRLPNQHFPGQPRLRRQTAPAHSRTQPLNAAKPSAENTKHGSSPWTP